MEELLAEAESSRRRRISLKAGSLFMNYTSIAHLKISKTPIDGAALSRQKLLFAERAQDNIIYCGDNLQQLGRLPDGCVDLVYIDPPFNSNRNYEIFWGEKKEKRSFEDRHASTEAYIAFMQPRCRELARVLRRTGSFYYHCDWHASHYIKIMLDRIFGQNLFENEIVWKRSSAHSDSGCCDRFGGNRRRR